MPFSKVLGPFPASALVLVLGVVTVLFNPFGWQTSLSEPLFDAWTRHTPMAGKPPVVAVDVPDLNERTLAATVLALAGQDARALVLTAPPALRPSPRQLIQELGPDPAHKAARATLLSLPEPGALLVKAAGHTDMVMATRLGQSGTPPQIKTRFVYRGAVNPFARIRHFHAAQSGPETLQAAAHGVGAANLPAGSDGIVRTIPIAFDLNGVLVPSLAAEALRVVNGQSIITVTGDAKEPLHVPRRPGIAGLETPDGVLPASPGGAIRLRWGPVPHLSLQQLSTQGNTAAKGAIAVIGLQSAHIPVPWGTDTMAGVTANAIWTLLSGHAPWRPLWARLIEALAIVFPGLALVMALRRRPVRATAMTAVAIAILFSAAWLVFARTELLLDAATPALTLALTLGAGLLTLAFRHYLNVTRLRLAFADSLPQASIEKIARNPGLLSVDGQTRTVTYLVCGVRGLSELAARYREDAPAFTSLMRQVITPLIDQALAHGGTIDRLTADGFTAFWNAPLDDPSHALHACEAASGMSILSSRITEQITEKTAPANITPPPIEIGVGLATGPVVAGGFGGYGRMGYSVNGDAVGLAQRIQALSYQYGPAVIVADTTRRDADRAFAWLEVDSVAVGAKDPPVTLYAMAGNPVMRASPHFRALGIFHDHIFTAIRRQQWGMARDLIAQCRRLSGASGKMYDLHLSRIAWYEKHPPGPDWDGAFRPPLN